MDDDKRIFQEAFERINSYNCNGKLYLEGPIVCYNGVQWFNTDGYNLGYNLYRLTKLVNDQGFFR